MRVITAVVSLLVVMGALLLFIGPDASPSPPIDPEDIDGYAGIILIDGQGVGAVSIASYEADTSVTYFAVPGEGSSFLGWYAAGGALLSVSAELTAELAHNPITATFGTADQVAKPFTFNYPTYPDPSGTASASFALVLSLSDYAESLATEDLPRRSVADRPYPDYMVDPEDYAVLQLAERLSGITAGMGDLAVADVILRCIQSTIVYTTDGELYETDEFWATPAETLYARAGDCEDTAVLFCSVASAMGFDTALVAFEGHMGAAIHVDGVTGGTEFLGAALTYVYVETASDSYAPIGALSELFDPMGAILIEITGDDQ
ncbi:MAG: hypothetical protein RBR71_12155 [Gudongella sp.]|nr:hypothetical protein [Gudongella sp.]